MPRPQRETLWQTIPFLVPSAGLHVLALWLVFGVVVRPLPPASLPVLTVQVRDPAPPLAKVAEASKPEPQRVVVRTKAVAFAALPARKAASVAALPLTAATTAAATSFLTPPAQLPRDAVEAVSAPPIPGPSIAARFDADYLHNPKPVYPIASRRLGEEGRVLLRVRVSAHGLPAEVDITQSSGFPRLDDAARAAVQRWRFVPARQGTEAVEASVLVPLQFTLDS